MKIYVDFDRTLFDCDSFLADIYALISKYNIPEELFEECQNQCKKFGFNPYLILKKVEEKLHFDKKIYSEIDTLIENTSHYLYSDTISFLEYLKSLNYEVIILTKGNLNYQKEKILNADIDDYYDDLIITLEHKGLLSLDYKNSIFIDDNPKEIDSILEKNPKMIIYIKHNSSNSISYSPKEVITVSSLGEIIKKKLV